MCFEEKILQAYLDGELSGPKKKIIKSHLDLCPECASLLAKLEDNNLFVNDRLKTYFIALEKENLDPGLCWQRLSGAENEENIKLKEDKKWKGALKMFSKYKKQVVAATLVAVVAISFSFSSVRVFAGNLLNVFRVEQIQTITFNQEDFDQLNSALLEGAGQIDINNLGKFEVDGKQETINNVNLQKAQKAVDFTLKLLGSRVEGSEPLFSVNTGVTIKFVPDTQKINQLLQSLGSAKLLSSELNGREFTIKIPALITAQYPPDSVITGNLLVAQCRSPELTAPEGVDVAAVRNALLAVPALPENIRRQLRAIGDWQHTIFIPNIEGSSTEVNVNGNKGVFITQPPLPAGHKDGKIMSGLVWQNEGVIYCLAGETLGLDQALALAQQMK